MIAANIPLLRHRLNLLGRACVAAAKQLEIYDDMASVLGADTFTQEQTSAILDRADLSTVTQHFNAGVDIFEATEPICAATEPIE